MTTMKKIKRNLAVLLPVWALIMFTLPRANGQPSYFDQGYAHNDYLHKKPLFNALENGYTRMEADIFLLKDSLIVAHWLPYGKNKRTLESLYLAPLRRIFSDSPTSNLPPITLVIDIKSSPLKTYLALRPLLEKYKDILSGFENGIYKQGKVNIILTGNKPVELVSKEANRMVMLDDMLDHASDDSHVQLFAMASCKYSHVLKWTGKGPIPWKEKTRLLTLVKAAHRQGKKARVWASPENEHVWNELLNCGVDYINTDQLERLKAFCQSRAAVGQTQVDSPAFSLSAR
jgi:hypothetical protein